MSALSSQLLGPDDEDAAAGAAREVMSTMLLSRFDPFADVVDLLDSVAAPPVGSARRGMAHGRFGALDAARRGDEVVVEVDLPGVDRESLDVQLDGDVVEISARRTAAFEGDDTLLAAERGHGEVRRRLRLGERLDAANVTASYDDGVLRVRVPVAEEARPRRVEVTSGPSRAAVGAGE